MAVKSWLVWFGLAICDVLPQVCLLLQMFNSRHFRRGFVVDPFALRVKSFSALQSSYMHLNQHSTVSWLGLLCIKRTYVSRQVRTLLSFAGLPGSGVHSLDHLPQR
jgi:hypothetical protein